MKQNNRYTDEKKAEIINFIHEYNASHHGRGGQSAAVKQFKVSPITIANWLSSTSNTSPSNTDNELNVKMKSMIKLSKKIQKLEDQLHTLKSKFADIKASL